MKRHAPATARNSAAIAEVLARELPAEGLVLEVASGTGEHAVYFARTFPNLEWQPSEREIGEVESVVAWAEEAKLTNLRPPVVLDAQGSEWPVSHADAVLCINMVHISPWAATEGLFRGAAAILSVGGPLILYGPYREKDVETAASNEQFELWLKQIDPQFGLRWREDMDRVAAECGLQRTARYAMPANNLTLVYRRQ